ncbi:MAG: nuclear transport factor 2 family protein [Myxococcota bacterium]
MKLVIDAMDGILVHHSEEQVGRQFHPDFVQHNPWAKDGAAHVKEMCAFEFGVQMDRYVVQGDIVAYHGIYTAPNPLGDMPLLCVDLWRVQGNQIVEHWDALQPIPLDHVEAFVGGPGDGGADVPPAQVASNAALVRRTLEGTAGAEAFAAAFTHHSPQGGDVEGLLAWRDSRSVEVRRTLASGDLVMAQLDTRGDKREVVYAWFRVNGNKLTDLWRVTQDFVSDEEAATKHPHF